MTPSETVDTHVFDFHFHCIEFRTRHGLLHLYQGCPINGKCVRLIVSLSSLPVIPFGPRRILNPPTGRAWDATNTAHMCFFTESHKSTIMQRNNTDVDLAIVNKSSSSLEWAKSVSILPTPWLLPQNSKAAILSSASTAVNSESHKGCCIILLRVLYPPDLYLFPQSRRHLPLPFSEPIRLSPYPHWSYSTGMIPDTYGFLDITA